MEYIVRSAAGANFQTVNQIGDTLLMMENSSLNQKFNIQANTAISNTDKVAEKYITIGNGAHGFKLGPNNIQYPNLAQHTPNHSGLYNHLPFVLRLPNNDLPAEQRAKYRLRRQETHNGQSYVAYYAKVLDLSETDAKLELRVVENGVVTSTPFAYTLDDLNPTPPTSTSGSSSTTSGDYIASTAKIPFTLSSSEIAELMNVCIILFGTDDLSIISEIGLCHGVDRSVAGDFNGVSSSYTEVIGCQITTFISCFFAVKYMNSGLNVTFDVGSVEPMLTMTTN